MGAVRTPRALEPASVASARAEAKLGQPRPEGSGLYQQAENHWQSQDLSCAISWVAAY